MLVSIGESVVRSMKGLRGGTREDLVTLFTADIDLDDGVRTFFMKLRRLSFPFPFCLWFCFIVLLLLLRTSFSV